MDLVVRDQQICGLQLQATGLPLQHRPLRNLLAVVFYVFICRIICSFIRLCVSLFLLLQTLHQFYTIVTVLSLGFVKLCEGHQHNGRQDSRTQGPRLTKVLCFISTLFLSRLCSLKSLYLLYYFSYFISWSFISKLSNFQMCFLSISLMAVLGLSMQGLCRLTSNFTERFELITSLHLFCQRINSFSASTIVSIL